jgi:hypothetical protein
MRKNEGPLSKRLVKASIVGQGTGRNTVETLRARRASSGENRLPSSTQPTNTATTAAKIAAAIKKARS